MAAEQSKNHKFHDKPYFIFDFGWKKIEIANIKVAIISFLYILSSKQVVLPEGIIEV